MSLSKPFMVNGSTSRFSRSHWCWTEINGEAYDRLHQVDNHELVQTARHPNELGVLKSAPVFTHFGNRDRVLIRFVTDRDSVRLPRIKNMSAHPFRPVKCYKDLEFSRISSTNARDSNFQIYAYRLVSNPNLVMYAVQGQIPPEFVVPKGRWQGTFEDFTDGSMGLNHFDNEFIEKISSPSHSDHESALPTTFGLYEFIENLDGCSMLENSIFETDSVANDYQSDAFDFDINFD